MVKIVLVILKNLAAFFVGAILSLLAALILPERSPLAVLTDKDIGFAIIALLPVLAMLVGVVGLAGGVFGVIVYNIVRFLRRKKIHEK